MAGSSLGNIFKITTWGESHGIGVGVVVDGCPSGISICEEDIQIELDKRKPGQSIFTTPRKESDTIKILSGVFEGKTTGTPISMMVANNNQRSKDYSNIMNNYRPGHADYTYDAKYGFRDYRGGGRSSGRETIGRVAAGAIAKLVLKELGVSINAYTKSIGIVEYDKSTFDISKTNENRLKFPNPSDSICIKEAEEYLHTLMSSGDSCGGIIECIISGCPAGIGNPAFEKLDSSLANSIMSIGAVKGVSFGAGFEVAKLKGSENNDQFVSIPSTEDINSNVFYKNEFFSKKLTNNAGGIYGGISDGSDITISCAIKPTPSISKSQSALTNTGETSNINISGRHDPIIVPRAVVVVESMTAITLLDLLLSQLATKIENIKKIYI